MPKLISNSWGQFLRLLEQTSDLELSFVLAAAIHESDGEVHPTAALGLVFPRPTVSSTITDLGEDQE